MAGRSNSTSTITFIIGIASLSIAIDKLYPIVVSTLHIGSSVGKVDFIWLVILTLLIPKLFVDMRRDRISAAEEISKAKKDTKNEIMHEITLKLDPFVDDFKYFRHETDKKLTSINESLITIASKKIN